MIRKAQLADLDAVELVYAAARRYMAENGNPKQWADGYPQRDLLKKDVEQGWLYVMEEDGRICGAFAFIVGDDPTYTEIREGDWFNGDPYGTIHRLAGDGTVRGLFPKCLSFCKGIEPNVRADTHAANKTMQHLLEKHGFQKCGIIHVWDGTPRIAYQYTGENGESL